jgi:membrane protein YdbS with pleckstrin-like domain
LDVPRSSAYLERVPKPAARADDLFAPADATWTSVEPALAAVRRLILGIAVVVVAVAACVVLGLTAPAWTLALPIVPGVVVGALGWVMIGRNQRSWRYAERDLDLLVSHGVMFRSLVVVPYGRMQYVDLQSGPLQRAFGISTVELHTATPQTDAQIPGLRPDDAARLREKLAALGNAQASGL